MLVEFNRILVQGEPKEEHEHKVELTEEEIEDLLSEKLLEGYELIEKSCPGCTTPLIKMDINPTDQTEFLEFPVLIPNRNPQKPFEPVEGVPLCVVCNSHVITQDSEMALIEKQEADDDVYEKKRDPSPRNQDVPLIDLTSHAEETVTVEYSVRREIATKVLGAKLLQGYVLKQEQCDKCGMPQMEKDDALECVVCPALTKKAAKQKKRIQQQATSEYEQGLLAQQERMRDEQEMHEEKMFKQRLQVQTLNIHDVEPQAVETPEMRPESPEMAIIPPPPAAGYSSPQTYSSPHTISSPRDIMFQREQQAKLEEEYRATELRRREEEILLMEETKRLTAMEEEYTVGTIRSTDLMHRDLLLDQHRNRLAAKGKLDEDILKLEQMRLIEEMESRRLAEERRAESEHDMIKRLEEDAASKAKDAEEAIENAKKALQQVETARKDILAQTIAMAEAEVIAEAEGVLKKDIEEYKAPVLLPSASELEAEQWETLRAEGRTIMTRRVMAGWTIVADFCRGTECEHSPLIMKRGQKECVVCGGCGDGMDGAYAISKSGSMDSEDGDEELDQTIARSLMSQSVAANTLDNAKPAMKHLQADFNTKKDMVSREIGRKMAEGWTLLDGTCPTCVMPLMADTSGKNDICVLCDFVGNHMKDTVSHPSRSTALPFKAPQASSRFMADPPANVGSMDGSEAETVQISIPRNFDFNDPNAIKYLMSQYATDTASESASRKSKEPAGEKRGFLEPASVTGHDSGDVIDLSTMPSMEDNSDSMVDMIAQMFMESPMGNEVKIMGSRIQHSDVTDLVNIYVATNYPNSVWTERTHLIAGTVWAKLGPVEPPTSIVAEVPRHQVSPRHRMSPRSGLPPKPEGASRARSRSRSKTPSRRNRASSFHFNDDVSIMSEASAAANLTLENILAKIEKCKETLKDDSLTVEQQMSAAALIEKLSKAALSVKGLEDIEL